MTKRCWLSSLFIKLGKASGKVGGVFQLGLLPFRAHYSNDQEHLQLANYQVYEEPEGTGQGGMISN